MLKWIKSLPVIVTLGMIGSVVLLVMEGRKVDRLHARANRKDTEGIALKNSQTSRHIQMGKELVESAHKDKHKAAEVKQAMEKRLDELGRDHETLDDIAHRFNSKRVRKQPTTNP